jgi:type II secretory pathway pseudopilin PulG
MRGQGGFTLIEAMVTGILSTMVAAVALALLKMSSDQVKEGSATLSLAATYSAVSEAIHRAGRNAVVVKTAGDPPGSPPGTVLGADTVTAESNNIREVVFCNGLGDSLGGFRIVSGTLHELAGPLHGRSWIPMVVGPDPVRLDDNASNFDLKANRAGIHFYLRLVTAAGDTLPPVKETVLCRGAAYRI